MPDLVGDELRVQILQDKADARALLALGKKESDLPSKRMVPVCVPCGCRMGFSCRRSVDLPQPDLPHRTVNEPASIESETFWSAGTDSVG